MTARNDSFAHDKLELHHRQQLSALMDGDLLADEARFLLRRLRHDRELAGCWERWQLCGDVLRGQAQAPAPAGFAERVALAVAAEAPLAGAADDAARRPRNAVVRWGGGALAASVALVALFMARQQSPQETPVPAGPQVAAQQQSPSPLIPAVPQAPADPAPDAEAYAAVAAVAVASVPRRQDNAARRSATRTQQAARSAARVARAEPQPQRVNAPPVLVEPVPALVASTPLHPQANPFAASRPQDAMAPIAPIAPQARPWPRSTLSGYPSATGALTTGYASDSAARTFYPFEPRLPATPPVAPETVPQE